jgi:hypothetical protein
MKPRFPSVSLQPPTDFAPFYVVHLEDYLLADNPFLDPVFASPKNAHIGILRSHAATLFLRHSVSLRPKGATTTVQART